MSQTANAFFGFVFLLVSLQEFGDCCGDNEVISGCRIQRDNGSKDQNLECFCGIGCQLQFPYPTWAHCEESLQKEKALADPCHSSPCLNHGKCVQLQHFRYRCECAGTKHYGEKCENECPKIERNVFGFSDTSLPSLDCVEF